MTWAYKNCHCAYKNASTEMAILYRNEYMFKIQLMYPKLKINVYFIFLNIGDLTFIRHVYGTLLGCKLRALNSSLHQRRDVS
jgi:hypothetical protein